MAEITNVCKQAYDIINRTEVPHVADDWGVINYDHDIKHIRYSGDYKGYSHPLRRLKRAFLPSRVLGETFGIRATLKRAKKAGENRAKVLVAHARAKVVVSLSTEDHLPDLTLYGGNIISHWMEHGWHIALWSPMVTEGIGEWMLEESQKSNPSEHAVRIAELIIKQEEITNSSTQILAEQKKRDAERRAIFKQTKKARKAKMKARKASRKEAERLFKVKGKKQKK